ncbi:hypothetical protein PIB30_010379 [Stylosanthes scabra]|uniref:Uncharacterized protein n=1 Tax=Stylosanthes scabra TaxID=79078 RepID=A0ABU6W3H1_9FABA|nr:hypothetical protein [Stylosanthes scabra]
MAKRSPSSAIGYRDLAGDLSRSCISAGKRIPFTKTNIRHQLGILGVAPDADVDDTFLALAKSYEKGEDMDMAAIYAVIGREDTNWADNPAVNLIPKTMNNAILNLRATA